MSDIEWTIEDFTKATGGYLRIFRNGKRVADVFPFAKDEDYTRVTGDALELVERANEYIAPPASKGGE